ncbi:adenylate cyclase [Kytococcus aerolatus]|uniref:Adenylate cyclase n=1 Tax=Kytococcus aerolatus TaxID=592308 RepID=A0A212TZL6_9MICO|nr:adenylate cyclase [Kytococcus aerolatus]
MERLRDVRPAHGEQPLLNHSLPSEVPPAPPGDQVRRPARIMDDIAERLFGRRRTMRRDEVARLAHIELPLAQRLWRALGFQNVRADDTAFSETDLEALRHASGLLGHHQMDEETLVALARGIGVTTERMATWQAEIFIASIQEARRQGHSPQQSDLLGHGQGAETVSDRLTPGAVAASGAAIADLADDLEAVIGYAWRRHLAAALATLFADATSEEITEGVTRSVGFADMVSFTERVAHASDRDVARLVTRFEELAADVIARHGGRVVKTIGDEVLYQANDPRSALLIAHDLVHGAAGDRLLPPLRAGVATGRVLLRLGDVYGATVNRASRLTDRAPAGQILCDAATAEPLRENQAWRFVEGADAVLRGVGTVTPFHLVSVPPGASTRAPRPAWSDQ